MTFQSVPDTAEAVVVFTVGGKEMVNVHHFKRVGGYSGGDISTLAALVDGFVGTDYLPNVTAAALYVETRVRGLTVENDLYNSASVNAGAGGAAGIEMPSNASFCVTLRTDFTGKSARGRFFAVPPSASVIAADSTVTSTYANNIVSYLENLRTGALLAGWVMVVVSRFHEGARRTPAITFEVSNIVARNHIIDSQRGRLPKGH